MGQAHIDRIHSIIAGGRGGGDCPLNGGFGLMG